MECLLKIFFEARVFYSNNTFVPNKFFIPQFYIVTIVVQIWFCKLNLSIYFTMSYFGYTKGIHHVFYFDKLLLILKMVINLGHFHDWITCSCNNSWKKVSFKTCWIYDKWKERKKNSVSSWIWNINSITTSLNINLWIEY